MGCQEAEEREAELLGKGWEGGCGGAQGAESALAGGAGGLTVWNHQGHWQGCPTS